MSAALPSFAVLPLTSVAIVLVQQPGGKDNGGQGEDFGKSSPVGLLVLILFLIAVGFLVRSMTKHLKRVPQSFDKSGTAESEPDAEAPAPETPEAAATPETAAAATKTEKTDHSA